MGEGYSAGSVGTDGALTMLYACALLYVALIYIRPAEIVPSLATIPFVDILTVVAAIIGVFSLGARPRPFFNFPQDKFLIAFWAMLVISSLKIWLWLAYTAWLAFMPVVFLYFLLRAAITSQAKLKGMIYALVALNVFLAVNGVLQYHTGVGFGNVTMKFGDRIVGTGIFNDPNDLGMTLVLALPFVFTMIGSRTTWFVLRILAIPALVLIFMAIYYTNSRGTLVGVAAVMASWAFLRFRTVSAGLVAMLLFAVIAIAAPSRGGEIDSGESSAQSRIHSWAEGWTMLKWYPMTGVGYGQYTEHHIKVAHNSFVHTFAELGLVGAFIFVGMFYWYFKGLRGIPESNAEFAPWRRAMMLSAIGAAVCGWFLSRQYVPIFYLLIAMGGSAVQLQLPNGETAVRTKKDDIMAIGALTIFGVLVVYFSIRTMAIWSGG